MQHNSCRQKPRPALSQKSFPHLLLPFFSFLRDSEAASPHSSGGKSLHLLRLVPFLLLAAQGHVSFFSYLIKKSSLNVLYFIQFVQIYSTSVSPHLQQKKEEKRERKQGSGKGAVGGGVPVTQVQGEESRVWTLRKRASQKFF